MTDNEIIKVFDCCYADKPCKQCPYYTDYKCTLPNDEADLIPRKIVDLINRQKAEIKRLQKQNDILSRNADTAFQDGLNEAQDLYAKQIKNEVKTEAFKEFAERCKEYFPSIAGAFDYFVKEMVGEGNENS